MEQSSSSVQHQPFQLSLLCSEFQVHRLLQNDGEEDAGTEGRRENCGRIKTYSYELVFNCSGKFFIREKSDYILRSGETHDSSEIGKQDEKKFEAWRSAEFSSAAERCILWRVDGWNRGETCRNRGAWGIMEFSESESWSIHEDEVTGKPVIYKTVAETSATSSFFFQKKSENLKPEWRKWPHNFYISSAVVSHMGKVHSIVRKTYDRGSTDDDLNVNAAIWRMFMNTIFKQQFILARTMIRIYNLLRIISGVLWRSYSKKRKIDQESDTDHWCINDWLRRVQMERDKLAVWQNLSDHECRNLRLRRLGALSGGSGGYKREPERSLEGDNYMIFWE